MRRGITHTSTTTSSHPATVDFFLLCISSSMHVLSWKFAQMHRMESVTTWELCNAHKAWVQISILFSGNVPYHLEAAQLANYLPFAATVTEISSSYLILVQYHLHRGPTQRQALLHTVKLDETKNMQVYMLHIKDSSKEMLYPPPSLFSTTGPQLTSLSSFTFPNSPSILSQ